MTLSITCPSGLVGEIRGLKVGSEGKMLSDRNLARSGATFDKILAGCWQQTLHAGIYELRSDGSLDWSKVLVADRFYALLQIRMHSFGDDYAFAVQCTSAACRAPFEWSLPLSQLPVVPLPEATRKAFLEGNRFETKLPRDGRRVWFRLMTGADELRTHAALKARRDDVLVTSLAMRVLEIDGVAERDKRTFIEDMEMADAAALLERFDAVDGGVDTSIDVECPDCLAIQEVQLPFVGSFFLPTPSKRTKARKAG